MGGYWYRVGNYRLGFMDYHFDEFPKDEDEEDITEFKDTTFFDNLMVDCTIERVDSGDEIKLDIPMSKLYTVEKGESGLWFVNYSDDKDGPYEWLFKTLKRQNKKIQIAPALLIHCSRDNAATIPDYYLLSDIGDDDIKVGVKEKRVFDIEALADLGWLFSRGFTYG